MLCCVIVTGVIVMAVLAQTGYLITQADEGAAATTALKIIEQNSSN